MSTLELLGGMEVGVCLAALVAVTAKKQWSDYWALGLFLAVHGLSTAIILPLLVLMQPGGSIAHIYYPYYFYMYWSSTGIETILHLVVIYSVFRLAMAPLKGLQTLGALIFRWAAAISVAVSLASAIAPGISGTTYLTNALSLFQRTQSILTLCLLLFVCFAVRPMGLSYSSRIFGVALGLGVLATNDLVQTAWFGKADMRTKGDVVNGIIICTAGILWTFYFGLPEPKRRMIVLPTTSPFLRWNQISLALGDEPGYVAIGGIPPELFAPAEIEVMRRASSKMALPSPFPNSFEAKDAASA